MRYEIDKQKIADIGLLDDKEGEAVVHEKQEQPGFVLS